MDRQHTSELISIVQHNFGPRSADQAVELGPDEFVSKAERQHDLIDAHPLQQVQMPLEQGRATKSQQTLGQLPILRLLKT